MAKQLSTLAILSFLISFSVQSFGAECHEFKSSTVLNEAINFINNSNLDEIWEDYNLAQNPAVLVDTSIDATCIAIYTGSDWHFKKLQAPVILENTVYEFLPNSSSNLELKELLKKMLIDVALVMSVHNFLTELPSNFPLNHNDYVKSIFAHEGFHLFINYTDRWPKWISGDGDNYRRDNLLSACYDNNKLNLRAEFRTILDAYKYKDNIHKFNSLLKEFISIRNNRYLAYPECKNIEAAWEIEEGVAEYVGNMHLIKYISHEQYIHTLELEFLDSEKAGTEYFYKLGLLQLHAIERIKPGLFKQANPLIGTKTTEDNSIFNLLKELSK